MWVRERERERERDQPAHLKKYDPLLNSRRRGSCQLALVHLRLDFNSARQRKTFSVTIMTRNVQLRNWQRSLAASNSSK